MNLEINDKEVAPITVGMILLGVALVSVSFGYTLADSQHIDYKDAYMNGTEYCVPEGWARIHNPQSNSSQTASFVYHSEKQFCIGDGQQSVWEIAVTNENGTISTVVPGTGGH